jgi:transposase
VTFPNACINHSTLFAKDPNLINVTESFWNQAKRHLRRYNGIRKQHFHLYLKECERCFNYRPARNLLKVLRQWRQNIIISALSMSGLFL